MNEVICIQPWHLYSTNRLTEWWHMPSVRVRQGRFSSNQVCLWSLGKFTLTKKKNHHTLHHASASYMCDISAKLNCPRDAYLDGCSKSWGLNHSKMWKGFWIIFILGARLKCSMCLPNPFTEKHFAQRDFWGKYNSHCIPLTLWCQLFWKGMDASLLLTSDLSWLGHAVCLGPVFGSIQLHTALRYV